ncbi:hypothetical protein LEP1GSC047_3952 [Leptospira inadai serovar Lyme str. 10]|uniref:Sigma factor regulatory protein, FecR/PupR family n=2 Tax=Leptospira inadai serovar Lyme TaxID=293084 RepID=V6HF57_9LEPT|nr:hypothetical protein [Leptospira inadai]EQA38173.1 hypothetical protein LEP1GSC047_3952 [Leptospira inadai serovar Lyme str. 10]PNV75144.1 hypothetical protein BES34_009615 [Leptospira inadai serovar Lyme]
MNNSSEWEKIIKVLERKDPEKWPAAFKNIKAQQEAELSSFLSDRGIEAERKLFREFRESQSSEKKVVPIRPKVIRIAYSVAAALLLALLGSYLYRSGERSSVSHLWQIGHSSKTFLWTEEGEKELSPGAVMPESASIRLDASGRLALISKNNSTFVLIGPGILKWDQSNPEALAIELDRGTLLWNSASGSSSALRIRTPYADYEKKGTIAELKVTALGDTLSILEGEFQVRVEENEPPIRLSTGQAVAVSLVNGRPKANSIHTISAEARERLVEFTELGVTQESGSKTARRSEKAIIGVYKTLQVVHFKDGSIKKGFVYAKGEKWYIHGPAGVEELPFEAIDRIETLENP